MNKENEELKPCPFCGGEAEIFGHTASWGAICTKCGSCNRQGGKTEAEAIKKWNNRADLNYSVFPNSSKLTYADVEKMVKPLEWELECENGDSVAKVGKALFRISYWDYGEMYIVFCNTFLIKGDISLLDEAKHTARKFLVDLVADALGVERSGE
jgi:Lar family restriction alleviation protein